MILVAVHILGDHARFRAISKPKPSEKTFKVSMNLLLERYKWKSSEGDFYIDAFFSNFIWFFMIKEIYNRGENHYLLKRNYKGNKT